MSQVTKMSQTNKSQTNKNESKLTKMSQKQMSQVIYAESKRVLRQNSRPNEPATLRDRTVYRETAIAYATSGGIGLLLRTNKIIMNGVHFPIASCYLKNCICVLVLKKSIKISWFLISLKCFFVVSIVIIRGKFLLVHVFVCPL